MVGRKLAAGLAVAVLLTTLCAQQSAAPDAKQGIAAKDLRWSPMEGFDGVEMAVLSGALDQAGPFTFRLRMRNGAVIPAHIHPVDEHVTVLKGTMLFGWGEKFDKAKTSAQGVGAYTHIEKEKPHFAQAKGETIIQVHGTGPFGLTVLEKK